MTRSVISAGSWRAWAIALLLLYLLAAGCGAAKDILASQAGATARCKDGTYTNHDVPAAGCHGHGGVDEYLNTSTPDTEPRLFAPEGRWAGAWTSDASPGLSGFFSLTVQPGGMAEGAFQSGNVSGTVRGTLGVSDNPAHLAPPVTELVMQAASSAVGGQVASVTYSAVFNRPAPNRLIGKLARISPADGEGVNAFPDSSCTVELTRQ
jgi:hypothetical protein